MEGASDRNLHVSLELNKLFCGGKSNEMSAKTKSLHAKRYVGSKVE